MVSYALFEEMLKAREIYDMDTIECDKIKKRKKVLQEQCTNVEANFASCWKNTELTKILTTEMTTNEKKFKCYNEMVKLDKEYVNRNKCNTLLFVTWYDLEKKVFHRE